jgi:predicted nucleic acid-binding protein
MTPPKASRQRRGDVSFPAFLDTCVLYGAVLSDTLLRLAEHDTFRPHWSAQVLDELSRNLQLHAGLSSEKAARRINQMQEAFPDASVEGYESLVEHLTCDPKDRHVLAAAAHAKCQVLVTFNLKDFPEASLDGLDLTVVHPDDFLLDQFDLFPDRVVAALMEQVQTSARPRLSYAELLGRLHRSGVESFVDEVRRLRLDLLPWEPPG